MGIQRKNISISVLGLSDKKTTINAVLANGFTTIHYDHIDGKFAPSLSLEPEEIKSLVQATKTHNVDVHVMAQNPQATCLALKDVADLISFHYETLSLNEITKLRQALIRPGLQVGLAIDLPTALTNEIIALASTFDFTLVMGVKAGKGGQTMAKEAITKVQTLVQHNIKVHFDGGINHETIKAVFAAGAAKVVVGSALTKSADLAKATSLLLGEK